MARIGIATIQEFSEVCLKAIEPTQITTRLGAVAKELGYTTWYAGTLMHEGQLPPNGFGFYEGSKEWSSRYADKGYSLIDPVVGAARVDENPIRWSDCARKVAGRDSLRRALLVLDEAREFRIRDGFTKAWHGFGDRSGVVSFGGERPDVSREATMSLMLVGAFAYEGLRRITQGFKPVPPVLTRREADVLRWVAEGKTAWEIGQILSIAERTVRCYVDQLKCKYRVPTPMQVVVRALLDGNLHVQSTRQN